MPYDVASFLHSLDATYAAQEGPERADALIAEALAGARAADDRGAELTVLNERLGLLRVTSRYPELVETADATLALVSELGIGGTVDGVTTLINVATGLRAAGEQTRSKALYERALAAAQRVMAPNDRRLAALHNNLSMLHGDAGDTAAARRDLELALAILRSATTDPARDTEIAATLVNLALARFAGPDRGSSDHDGDALSRSEIAEALAIYDRVGAVDPHAASALAALGQLEARAGDDAAAAAAFTRALAILEACFGADSDAYRITAENLVAVGGQVPSGVSAETRATPSDPDVPAETQATPSGISATPGRPAPKRTLKAATQPAFTDGRTTPEHLRAETSGLDLARAYWEEHGEALLARFPEHAPRIAVGLVGHGSECYGFDDLLSRDHDFGPELCLWLTAEDHAEIGEELQAAYETLPARFDDVTRPTDSERSPRSRGTGRRRGVFEIGAFFESITGYREAPAADKPHEWLLLEEATLAAATNGAVFRDQLGAFSTARKGFTRMPEDVRLALVSRRLGMVAQAGQYNLPRMLERGDGGAAWLAIAETVHAAASLVFLVNGPSRVGYLPYYKWELAALRRLSGRIATRLPGVCALLEELQRLASAACFGGAGFGEGGKGADPARERSVEVVEEIAGQIVDDFLRRRWTTSSETFLEWQRPHVEAAITTEWLRSI